MRPLKEIVGRSIILCYREDPAQLVQSLEREGLNPIIQRQVHSPEIAGWTNAVMKLGRNASTIRSGR